ncbi:MAG: nucleoside triphosphate pyrophosphatase [SAR202 cluster bacterium]|nr:nucleoside triphosphate pyrophosphatase [SAR202 cluster bacterium]
MSDAAAPRDRATSPAGVAYIAHENIRMESTTTDHKTRRTRHVVLASSSPRRRELMRALDIRFDVVDSNGEEGPPLPGETPEEFVVRLSSEKANQASDGTGPAIVLGADTAVVLDGEVMGKPATGAEAAVMLQRLRGRVHRVVSGATAIDRESGRSVSACKSTEVEMRNYSRSEMAAYVASGEPMDKAGAYGIQDETFRPAHKVRGCYLNVVGLPLCEVVELLEALGTPVSLKPDWRVPAQCDDCPLRERPPKFKPEVSRP